MFLCSVEGPVHTPDKAQWNSQLSSLLSNLDETLDPSASSPFGWGNSSLGSLDKDLAWQEYMANGQQVREAGQAVELIGNGWFGSQTLAAIPPSHPAGT